jgi:hypothetical protein
VKLLNRKSRRQRLLESVIDSLTVRSASGSILPARGTSQTLKGVLPRLKLTAIT